MKKIKKKLLTAMLCTICYRNVDRLYNLRHYDSYNVKLGKERPTIKSQAFFEKN